MTSYSTKRNTVILLLILLFSISFVIAINPGHSANEIEVNINGNIMTLQEAISNNKISTWDKDGDSLSYTDKVSVSGNICLGGECIADWNDLALYSEPSGGLQRLRLLQFLAEDIETNIIPDLVSNSLWSTFDELSTQNITENFSADIDGLLPNVRSYLMSTDSLPTSFSYNFEQIIDELNTNFDIDLELLGFELVGLSQPEDSPFKVEVSYNIQYTFNDPLEPQTISVSIQNRIAYFSIEGIKDPEDLPNTFKIMGEVHDLEGEFPLDQYFVDIVLGKSFLDKFTYYDFDIVAIPESVSNRICSKNINPECHPADIE